MAPVSLLAERGEEWGNLIANVLLPCAIVSRDLRIEYFNRIFAACTRANRFCRALFFESPLNEPALYADPGGSVHLG
jgi:hypothetical protein